MRIVADENIPYLRDAFSSFGEIHTLPGRSMSAGELAGAEVLLVRSVTPVGPELIEGTPVRFVGTATIGTDHLDTAYLESRGIKWAAAPGSNAASVADYVTSALLEIQRRRGMRLKSLSAAVIGFGNVGSRVAARLSALGISVMINDPPLREQSQDERFRPVEEVLPRADIITLHVPLAGDGPFPTLHLADEGFFKRMKPGAVFLNTSRGKVVDQDAFLKAHDDDLFRSVIFDVFHEEPNPSPEVLDACDIATPHIAGYALDGKARGSLMLHQALSEFLGGEPSWDMEQALPEPAFRLLELPPDESAVTTACLTVYDISRDDAGLREIRSLPEPRRGAFFDQLRKDYPVRREFRNTSIRFTSPAPEELTRTLSGLTFRMET